MFRKKCSVEILAVWPRQLLFQQNARYRRARRDRIFSKLGSERPLSCCKCATNDDKYRFSRRV